MDYDIQTNTGSPSVAAHGCDSSYLVERYCYRNLTTYFDSLLPCRHTLVLEAELTRTGRCDIVS